MMSFFSHHVYVNVDFFYDLVTLTSPPLGHLLDRVVTSLPGVQQYQDQDRHQHLTSIEERSEVQKSMEGPRPRNDLNMGH